MQQTEVSKTQRVPLSSFLALRLFQKSHFSFIEIFFSKTFSKFFNVSKESPFNFFDILQQLGFSKSRRGPPLTSLKQSFALGPNWTGTDVKFVEKPGQLQHIFRDARGHFKHDTPENRKHLLDAIKPEFYKGCVEKGGFKKHVYERPLNDGERYIWVEVCDDQLVRNGGISSYKERPEGA